MNSLQCVIQDRLVSTTTKIKNKILQLIFLNQMTTAGAVAHTHTHIPTHPDQCRLALVDSYDQRNEEKNQSQ